jgi:iron complex outermembrane receptor protein
MRSVVLRCLSALVFLIPAAPAASQTLSGRIADATTGAALAARIEVLDTHAVVTSGPDGRFSIHTGDADRLTVVVSLPGYYVQRATVDTRLPATMEVRLSPIVTIMDRVEVTATRAREGTDPVTLTNVSQDQVADAHWGQDPAMLLAQAVPGVFATNDSGNGIGYSYFSIRGFGQARSRVMLNGAPLNDAESGELFFIDLADFMSTGGDVQVRRGVFGLSGLGGSLDFTTALPSVERRFSIHTGAGSYGTRRLTVLWDSGLVDGTWAFSGRYSKITTDGYRDQSWVDMWNYYMSAARYGERSRLRLLLFGGPERTHLAYDGVDQATLDGGLTGDADVDRRSNPLTYPGEIDNFFQPHYQLVHDLTLSDRTRFSQTLYAFLGDGYYDQYRSRRWLFEYNLPDVTLSGGTVITRSDLVRRRNVDEWDAGWVPTFSHTMGRLALELSGEWRMHRAHHVGEVTWSQYYPVGVAPNQRYYDYKVAKNTMTGLATARVAVTSRLSLSGGLQIAHHTYELSEDKLKDVSLTESFAFVLPRAGAVFKLSAAGNAYVNVARGQREPFFRNIYDPQDYYSAPASLDPEDVWNVEAGTSWRRGRWHARGNVYWMRFLNEIVYAGALDDNGVPVYGNGARSTRRGIEFDGSAALTRHLSIDGAWSLSRNRFTTYREHDYEGGVIVYDGNPVAGFPGVMASLSARADIGGHHFTAGIRHVGEFHLDNTGNGERLNPAYTVVDASAKLTVPSHLTRRLGLSQLDVDLRVNNVFDRRYTASGYVDSGTPLFIPAAGRNVYGGLTLGL